MDGESFQARHLDFLTYAFGIRERHNRYRVVVTYTPSSQRYYIGYDRYNPSTQTYEHIRGSSDSANDSISAFAKAERLFNEHASRIARLESRIPSNPVTPAPTLKSRSRKARHGRV